MATLTCKCGETVRFDWDDGEPDEDGIKVCPFCSKCGADFNIYYFEDLDT